MSNLTVLYIGNDNVLELDALKDDLTGAYLDGATVTVTLYTTDFVEIGGDTWPKAMDYVEGSRGLYRATLPYTLALSENERVVAIITADAGNGLRARWKLACVARSR